MGIIQIEFIYKECKRTNEEFTRLLIQHPNGNAMQFADVLNDDTINLMIGL